MKIYNNFSRYFLEYFTKKIYILNKCELLLSGISKRLGMDAEKRKSSRKVTKENDM